jgi:hypothetical protein
VQVISLLIVLYHGGLAVRGSFHPEHGLVLVRIKALPH